MKIVKSALFLKIFFFVLFVGMLLFQESILEVLRNSNLGNLNEKSSMFLCFISALIAICNYSRIPRCSIKIHYLRAKIEFLVLIPVLLFNQIYFQSHYEGIIGGTHNRKLPIVYLPWIIIALIMYNLYRFRLKLERKNKKRQSKEKAAQENKEPSV